MTSGTVGFGDTQASIVAADNCGAQTLSVAGVAICGVADVVSVNNDTVTAAYSGSSLYAPSTANANVSPDVRTTSLELDVSGGVLVVGQTSILTVTLNQPIATGTVSFSDTAGLVAGCSSVAVDPATSTATCTTTAPATVGSDSITASYGGDTNDSPVSSVTTVPIDAIPTVTSATSFTSTVGQAFTATVTTSGTPAVVAIGIDSGTLPGGLSLTDNHDGTATISGTLSPGAGGTYSLGLALNDGVLSSVTATIAFVIDQAPAFTTTSSASCVASSVCEIAIATSGYPSAELGESAALPSGLDFVNNGNGTGDILGTATTSDVGTGSFVIAATNGVGAGATQDFTLTVSTAPAPPSSPPPGGSGPGPGSPGNSTGKNPQPLKLTSYTVKGSLSGTVDAGDHLFWVSEHRPRERRRRTSRRARVLAFLQGRRGQGDARRVDHGEDHDERAHDQDEKGREIEGHRLARSDPAHRARPGAHAAPFARDDGGQHEARRHEHCERRRLEWPHRRAPSHHYAQVHGVSTPR